MLPFEQLQSTLVISAVFYILIGYIFASNAPKSSLGRFPSLISNRNALYKSLLAIGALAVVKLGYDQRALPLNYYSIMEVGRHDSMIEVRKSYKTLSRTYHPDKNTASNAEEIFQTIKVAYDALMDETQREIYNRFGPYNLEFDPRRDELRLIVDLLTVYVFWGVIAYISTIPAGAKGSRTWITIIGILFMAVEVTFKLTETAIPDWLPKTLTEYELIYYLHSLFPVIIAALRAVSESQYIDVDDTSLQVLAEVWKHQKDVNELLQQFDLLVESTKKNVNESNETVLLGNITEKIQSIKSELENSDDQYAKYLEDLKASSSSLGSNYYWVVFILLYGGIYLFQ